MSHPKSQRTGQRTVEDRYRQTKRKLGKAKKAGPSSVAAYLAASFMARRLVGLERGLPGSIQGMALSSEELLAYQQRLIQDDQARATAFGSIATARRAWCEQSLMAVSSPGAEEIIEQIHLIDESALLFFGFADNSSRAVTLYQAGTTTTADTEPAADVAHLVQRLFNELHGLLVVIASRHGEIINAYDLDQKRFVQTAQRSIRVVAVINQHPIYFEPENAQRCLESGDAFAGHLPRLAGASYVRWPLMLDSTEQE